MLRSKYAIILLIITTACLGSCSAQNSPYEQNYVFQKGDPNGIGKWYMGREIAHVMGFQAMNWLEREDREEEERSSLLMENMEISKDDVIADIGAGSGYHVFKMAAMAADGKVYAVDIQQEMLDAIQEKRTEKAVDNIVLVKGEEQSSNLPQNAIDKILMVDVYHEFSHPKEMLASLHQALKRNGKIYLIEYRMEDPNVPIKTVHKMSQAQAAKEFKANGFELLENIDNLPWQHCMVFGKAEN